jgi:Flp pilus assembly protein TadB
MKRCRPFKLIDAMILIAAVAVWMALMRTRWSQFQTAWSGSRKAPTWGSYVGIAEMGLNLSLSMLTVAYLVMRLIPPRPNRSDLIRQPGMLFLGLSIALMILLMLLSAFVPLVPWTNIIIALALGLPWFAAARRYRSRAELGWIEGVGRSVGMGWIVTTAAIYPLLVFR